MIDISAYNAYILWTAVHPYWNNKRTKVRMFLEKLGNQLIKLHMESRAFLPRVEVDRKIMVKVQNEKNQNHQ